jgi:hypothetical protein
MKLDQNEIEVTTWGINRYEAKKKTRYEVTWLDINGYETKVTNMNRQFASNWGV